MSVVEDNESRPAASDRKEGLLEECSMENVVEEGNGELLLSSCGPAFILKSTDSPLSDVSCVDRCSRDILKSGS
jgi:hypothetical protein